MSHFSTVSRCGAACLLIAATGAPALAQPTAERDGSAAAESQALSPGVVAVDGPAKGTQQVSATGHRVALSTASGAALGLGAATLASSLAFFGLAGSNFARIPKGPGDSTQPAGYVAALGRDGATYQTLGWVFAGASAASLVTCVSLFILSRRAEPAVIGAVVPTSGGAAVSLRGSF